MDIDLKELISHKKDGWIAINNKIYDVSNFVDDHPGGAETIKKFYGKDATNDFLDIHPSGEQKLIDTWGESNKNLYYKGTLKSNDREINENFDNDIQILSLGLLFTFIIWMFGSYILTIFAFLIFFKICYNFINF